MQHMLYIHMYVIVYHICNLWSCRIEIEKEVRLQVDELMREELKNLKLVYMTVFVHACNSVAYICVRLWTGTKVVRKRKGKRRAKR